MAGVTMIVLLLTVSVYSKPSKLYVPCEDQGMAKYNITFETFWTEERFPKQFPTFRPHAQWAKLVGRTHSSQYRLWEEGALCSSGVMEYVEKGSTESLDMEVQGMDGILDIFHTRSLNLGIGVSSVKVLADPYHSKVSVMARLIPSPDWFVGVDSLDLCKDGKWVDKLTRDLPPYDAGTDRGFTFTAPNWPEVPYKEIYQITSKMPNHPANSFFYPELDALPVLATLTAVKVETISPDKASSFREKKKNTLNDDNNRRHYQPKEPVVFGETPAEKKVSHMKQPEFNLFRTDMRPKAYTPAPSNPTTTSARPSTPRKPGYNMVFPQSCEVSDWQEWSACSKTCGYGTRMRTRAEVKAQEDGGAPCPALKQEELCGSMRSCTWNHFNTFAGRSQSTKSDRAGRRRSILFRRRKMRRNHSKKTTT